MVITSSDLIMSIFGGFLLGFDGGFRWSGEERLIPHSRHSWITAALAWSTPAGAGAPSVPPPGGAAPPAAGAGGPLPPSALRIAGCAWQLSRTRKRHRTAPGTHPGNGMDMDLKKLDMDLKDLRKLQPPIIPLQIFK